MLVQLSGVPGSGKSTLARALASARGFVVVDTDVLKTALLDSGVPLRLAGPATYSTALRLAGDLLTQGQRVVLDSPCRYPALLEGGLGVAAAAGVPYRFIELRAADPSMLLPRLDQRRPLVSQVASGSEPAPGSSWELGTAEATLAGWQEQLVHPEDDWLRLDAAGSPDDNTRAALAYLDQPPRQRSS